MTTASASSSAFRWSVAALALVACAALPAGGQERELTEGKKKLSAMIRQAEELKASGATEKAEVLMKQAAELKRWLARASGGKDARPSTDKILGGLKAGAASLRALGRNEEAARMEQLAEEYYISAAQKKEKAAAKKVGRQNPKSEREVAVGRLRVMRMAVEGLVAAGRNDSAALVEHAIRADALALEGKKDAAAAARKKAPNLGQRVELMMFAARKLKEAGKREQSAAVGKLGEQLLAKFKATQKREREASSEKKFSSNQTTEPRKWGGTEEQKAAAAQIEMMQLAHAALREGGKRDSADVLNRAIQARLVRLRGSKGEEARHVLSREPKVGQTAEVMMLAAELWADFGHEKNAAVVNELAVKFARTARSKRGETQPGRSDARSRQIEGRIAELEALLEKRRAELKALERELKR